MKTLKGNLSIFRWTGSGVARKGPTTGIHITLEDENSRTMVVKIVLTPEQLGLALTGLSSIPCDYEFNNSGLVGMRHENKDILVPLEENVTFEYLKGPEREAAITKALAPYEADGWAGERRDFENHHRWDSKSKTQRVTFHRWVNPRTGQPVTPSQSEPRS